jgi:phasin
MREANTTAAGTKSTGPQKWEAPQTIREMANKGTAQTKEAYDKMNAATAEASNLIQNAYSTAAQGATDFNPKLIEFALANSNAAFDYASQLLGVKSQSEFLEMSTNHGRKQLEVLSEQTRELTALSHKVMLETAEPLKAGAVKAFRGPLA